MGSASKGQEKLSNSTIPITSQGSSSASTELPPDISMDAIYWESQPMNACGAMAQGHAGKHRQKWLPTDRSPPGLPHRRPALPSDKARDRHSRKPPRSRPFRYPPHTDKKHGRSVRQSMAEYIISGSGLPWFSPGEEWIPAGERFPGARCTNSSSRRDPPPCHKGCPPCRLRRDRCPRAG